MLELLPRLLLLMVTTVFSAQDPPVALTPRQARTLLAEDSSFTVLDVRTEREYRSGTGRLVGAILLPVQELSERIGELEPYKASPVLVYCRTDNRSRRAVAILREAGVDARYIQEGITGWNREGFPVETEP